MCVSVSVSVPRTHIQCRWLTVNSVRVLINIHRLHENVNENVRELNCENDFLWGLWVGWQLVNTAQTTITAGNKQQRQQQHPTAKAIAHVLSAFKKKHMTTATATLLCRTAESKLHLLYDTLKCTQIVFTKLKEKRMQFKCAVLLASEHLPFNIHRAIDVL